MNIFLRYAKRIVLVTNIVIGYNVGVVIAGSIAFAQTSMLMKQWEKIFIVELVYITYIYIYIYIYIYMYIYMINIYIYICYIYLLLFTLYIDI